MAELFNYTAGRLGSHSIQVCKPIGGSVIDVQHPPIDIANSYIEQGYYQCDDAGPLPDGHYIETPADHTPAPVATVAVQPAPTTLPAVGASWDAQFVVAFIIAFIITMVILKKRA